MLEHYLTLIAEISNVNKTTLLMIQSTESLIQLSLDTQRNSLILFELRGTLANISIACSTFITSIYGMNLVTGVEDTVGHVEHVVFWYNLTDLIDRATSIGILTFLALNLRLRMKNGVRVSLDKWTKQLRSSRLRTSK